MVGQAEWMLTVTIGSLVGVGAMGANLAFSLWKGSPPRPVPLTTWLGVMALAASVLWTRWDEDETNTIVAAVATAGPICSLPGAPALTEGFPGGAWLQGYWSSSPGCHVWAFIEDPRTGTVWLQGPATIDSSTWTLSLALATADGTGEQLAYEVSIAVVDDETHEGWLQQSAMADGIVSLDNPHLSAWLARDVPL